jgi:hypothetical protein
VPKTGAIGIARRGRVDVGVPNKIARQLRGVVVDNHTINQHPTAVKCLLAACGNLDEHYRIVSGNVKVGVARYATSNEAIRRGVVKVIQLVVAKLDFHRSR